MRVFISALFAVAITTGAGAQQYAASDYRVCPAAQTEKGRRVVEEACGSINPPDFTEISIQSLPDLKMTEAKRDTFRQTVADYGVCITRFINGYRRPGADATATAPDEAACAHAWAEDQVTQAVIAYGRACIDFSNRSVTDGSIEPWTGACYPAAQPGQG
ncbi:MAG: hypothetical protein AAGJ29_10840 [Pseudomonadota bacterium]